MAEWTKEKLIEGMEDFFLLLGFPGGIWYFMDKGDIDKCFLMQVYFLAVFNR